ncbi:MAG TPA: rhomboid family intramembrane serine protease [Pyrinomonadaceae bacterium]|nr:rhomboid family intramembrane serine protease [Pyrinomonadaceae bacterium]
MTFSPRKPAPGMSARRFAGRPLLTISLIALNFICWFAVAASYHLSPFATHNSTLLLKVGAVNGELLRAGQWWRLCSSQFLHVHFLHLVFNMAALLLLGYAVEDKHGSWRFALAFAACGIAGQFIGVLAAPELVSSGASQALMGLVGWVIIEHLRQYRLNKLILLGALVVAAVQVVLDVSASGGIKAGHLGGFFIGVMLNLLMSRQPKRT